MSLLSATLHSAEEVVEKNIEKQRDELLPKLEDLIERTELLSFHVQQNFVDTYCNFTITNSLEQYDYRKLKSNILSDYDKLLKDINTINEKSETINEVFSKYCKKLESTMTVLKDLCVVVNGKQILDKASHEFGRNNYKDAIFRIKDFLKQLSTLKFEDNAGKALINLINHAENQLALFTAQLSIEWEDIFTWVEKTSIYRISYSISVQQCDPILKQNVLNSLYAIEKLNAELSLFSHFFIEKLLHNIVRYDCNIYIKDHLGASVYNIVIDLKDPKKPYFQSIFKNLIVTLQYLESTLGQEFEDNKNFIQTFANLIKQKFFNKIIEDCIRNNLPSCDSSYMNYKNIVEELVNFNKFLVDIKFIEEDESPLTKYINDGECILYRKKWDKLLSDIRALLGQSLSYGTIIAGNFTEAPIECKTKASALVTNNESWELNNPMFLPKCVISNNVNKIMLLIFEHLEECTKVPEKYCRQFIIYIKDIALMYQCLIPKKFKVNLEVCPLDIALYFNNCYYLAHSLMGPPWKKILPSSLADLLTVTLVDSIQNLRIRGLETVTLYLESQKNIITKNIEDTELPWTNDSYQTFDAAVNSALTILKDLKSSWLDILPVGTYEQSMYILVETLCQAMLNRMFADTELITEHVVYMLAGCFEDTVVEITSLFVEERELGSKINIWSKFTKMPQLLKGQLYEITELCSSDELLSQGFVCSEIRNIVKMRFPDDKYKLEDIKCDTVNI